MIKIFLVEDEMILRNAIKTSIDWEAHGYEFAGEASDGELAYPLILKTIPDILITDIKMPFMDGLELSEALRKKLPDLKIIILSGYNDFDYAKKAISIGITDYLLKPISAEKLLEAIGKVVGKIRKERSEKELLLKYSDEMQENTEMEKNLFFTRLLTENMSITEALEQGRNLDMNLSAGYFSVLLFKILNNENMAQHAQESVKAWEQIESYGHQRPQCYCIRRGVDGLAFLSMGDEEGKVIHGIEEIRRDIKELMENYPQLKYFGGIGQPVDRLRNLKISFHDAERAFAGRFTAESNQIVSVGELHSGEDGADSKVQGVGSIEIVRGLISRFLRSGTEEEVPAFIQACFDEIPEDNLRSMMMRQYFIMDIYIQVVTFGEELHISQDNIQEACGDMKSVSDSAGTVEQMRHFAERLIHYMVIQRDTISGRRYSDIIEHAQAYILSNYMSDNISLNAVAASVGMSPSYFSSIFSQEVGKTFVEYLTEIRMDKAKELLMCSSKKTSEIGYQVGYKDAHYFSYIFKKTQKCSPKEYRARGKLS